MRRCRASVGLLDEPATAATMAGFLCRGLGAGALNTADLGPAGLDAAGLLVLARHAPAPA